MGFFGRNKDIGFGSLNSKKNNIPLADVEPLEQRKAFFDKQKSEDISPAEPIDTIISEDVSYVGDLATQGAVIVDGTIEGNMHCTEVNVMKTAQILGTIVARRVTIAGLVRGNVHAQNVRISAGADIQGDIYHQGLAMEPKAIFDGSSQRMDDPYCGAPRPEWLEDGVPLLNAL